MVNSGGAAETPRAITTIGTGQKSMGARKRLFPFNAEQTINILSEFGPLVTMFVVNAMYGIDAGTWALIITTGIAIGTMFYVFGRPPVFPLIASTVTVVFGALTLITGNPMWVQIKVTIFNAMFAGVLFGGLYGGERAGHHRSLWAVMGLSVVGLALPLGYYAYKGKLAALASGLAHGEFGATIERMPEIILVAAVVIGFVIGSNLLKRNFFKYVFEKTFHYTEQGWDTFTWSFAWFFVLTAVANELVRWGFPPPPPDVALQCGKSAHVAVDQCIQQLTPKTANGVAACKTHFAGHKARCLEPYSYDILGHKMDGVNIWILFKIALIMPASGIYAWILTRAMHKHRIPEGEVTASGSAAQTTETARGLDYAPAAGEAPAAMVKVRNVGGGPR